MATLLTIAGAALVVVTLREVFASLFFPQGRRHLSRAVVRGIWHTTKAASGGNHTVLSLAGPVAFLTVIVVWGTLVVVGFALILWPRMPEDFAFGAGVDPGSHSGFLDAAYLSMVNLTSLGYGDVVATDELLRLLGPTETLIGLGLMTASISWILMLYRVLADYRSLSHEISILIEAERDSGISLEEIEPASAAETLSALTTRVVAMRDDFVNSPIVYYFHPRDPRHALPLLLPRLLDIVRSCRAPDRDPALRLDATMLGAALDDLVKTIARSFTRSAPSDTRDALAAYRRDHLWHGD